MGTIVAIVYVILELGLVSHFVVTTKLTDNYSALYKARKMEILSVCTLGLSKLTWRSIFNESKHASDGFSWSNNSGISFVVCCLVFVVKVLFWTVPHWIASIIIAIIMTKKMESIQRKELEAQVEICKKNGTEVQSGDAKHRGIENKHQEDERIKQEEERKEAERKRQRERQHREDDQRRLVEQQRLADQRRLAKVYAGNYGATQHMPVASHQKEKIVRIGRGPANDIRINDEKVSWSHLLLVRTSDGIVKISDLGSTNGTYVNGKRIKSEFYLNLDDEVRIGSTVLLWKEYVLD